MKPQRGVLQLEVRQALVPAENLAHNPVAGRVRRHLPRPPAVYRRLQPARAPHQPHRIPTLQRAAQLPRFEVCREIVARGCTLAADTLIRMDAAVGGLEEGGAPERLRDGDGAAWRPLLPLEVDVMARRRYDVPEPRVGGLRPGHRAQQAQQQRQGALVIIEPVDDLGRLLISTLSSLYRLSYQIV